MTNRIQGVLHECAHCHQPIETPKTPGFDKEPPRIGDILVCTKCRTLSQVTLTGTAPFTKEELAKLSPDEQEEFRLVLRILSQK